MYSNQAVPNEVVRKTQLTGAKGKVFTDNTHRQSKAII